MRHCHRAASCHLFLKLGDDAAGASKDVAESDDDHVGLPGAVLQTLANHLSEAFSRAHHVGRLDCLVGGYQDETLDAVSYRSASDDMRSDHVVKHCLPCVVLFHQRYVLISSRMEDDRWPCFAENLIDARRVLHIADKCEKRHVRKCVAEFLLQAIQRIFVLFEKYDPARLEIVRSAGTVRTRSTRRHRLPIPSCP